jgi:hypothetical protein
MITETELAIIDAANDEYRRIAGIMIQGGWDIGAIRHAHRANNGGCPGCHYCD